MIKIREDEEDCLVRKTADRMECRLFMRRGVVASEVSNRVYLRLALPVIAKIKRVEALQEIVSWNIRRAPTLALSDMNSLPRVAESVVIRSANVLDSQMHKVFHHKPIPPRFAEVNASALARMTFHMRWDTMRDNNMRTRWCIASAAGNTVMRLFLL